MVYDGGLTEQQAIKHVIEANNWKSKVEKIREMAIVQGMKKHNKVSRKMMAAGETV